MCTLQKNEVALRIGSLHFEEDFTPFTELSLYLLDVYAAYWLMELVYKSSGDQGVNSIQILTVYECES